VVNGHILFPDRPRAFVQAFTLSEVGGRYFVASDSLRFSPIPPGESPWDAVLVPDSAKQPEQPQEAQNGSAEPRQARQPRSGRRTKNGGGDAKEKPNQWVWRPEDS
jgi:hypothetical protein